VTDHLATAHRYLLEASAHLHEWDRESELSVEIARLISGVRKRLREREREVTDGE
jgi:hypothetical protein